MGTKNRINDPADFLAAIIGQSVDLPVEGLGIVKVRGLTVQERKTIRPHLEDNEDLTVQVVALGMVEPRIPQDQVNRLYDADNKKLTTIARKILALSAEQEEEDLEKKLGIG